MTHDWKTRLLQEIVGADLHECLRLSVIYGEQLAALPDLEREQLFEQIADARTGGCHGS